MMVIIIIILDCLFRVRGAFNIWFLWLTARRTGNDKLNIIIIIMIIVDDV